MQTYKVIISDLAKEDLPYKMALQNIVFHWSKNSTSSWNIPYGTKSGQISFV